MTFLEAVNTPPTLEEAQQLRTLVEADETELANIRQAMRELRAREETVCARMKRKRRLLSLIRHLPHEILAKIFILWHEERNYIFTRPWTPFRVAHVSSRWRAIALSTPRLWTHAKFHFFKQRFDDESFNILKAFLLRSEPHTTDLEFRAFDKSDHRTPQKGIERLVEALVLCMSRVRRLSLLELPNTAWQTLYNAAQTSYLIPLLEELDLSIAGVPPLDSVEKGLTIFRDAPRLKRLSLDLKRGGDHFVRWVIPYPGLTDLKLSCVVSAAAVRQVLLQCVSLHRCDLATVEAWDDTDTIPTVPVRMLPQLRDFRVRFPNYDFSITESRMQLFQPLDMPALARLTITAGKYSSTPEVPLLIEYVLSRSGPSLTHLILSHVKFNQGEVLAALSLLPLLEELSLTYCSAGNDELFSSLCYSSSDCQASTSPPLLPRLHSLKIHDIMIELQGPTSRALEGMILSRWWLEEEGIVVERMVAKWSNLELCWDYNESDREDYSLTSVVKRSRSEGLKILFYVPPRRRRSDHDSD